LMRITYQESFFEYKIGFIEVIERKIKSWINF